MIENSKILLFDGVCNLCSAWVRLIIPQDPGKQFRFCSLQSPQGQERLRIAGLPENSLNSVVLLEGSRVFTESTAVLRILKRLAWLWPLFYLGILIPPFLRDALYRFVARNRYRWFGKKETCLVPPSDWKERFLDA